MQVSIVLILVHLYFFKKNSSLFLPIELRIRGVIRPEPRGAIMVCLRMGNGCREKKSHVTPDSPRCPTFTPTTIQSLSKFLCASAPLTQSRQAAMKREAMRGQRMKAGTRLARIKAILYEDNIHISPFKLYSVHVYRLPGDARSTYINRYRSKARHGN